MVFSVNIGFVFDLDGTLLDDIDLARNIPLLAANELGYRISSDESSQLEKEILDMLGKQGSKFFMLRILVKVAKRHKIPFYKWVSFIKLCKKQYLDQISTCPLFEGTEALIDQLLTDYGYIGILTQSSSKEIAQRFRGREEFLDKFRGNVLGRDDVERMKPDPEGILYFSSKWGVPPENMIMIGDMRIDIQTGKNAGCVTIGVLTGFDTKEQLSEVQADFIVEEISEISSLLPDIIESMS